MPGIYSEIEQLSKLKNIDPTIVIEAVKDAILVAARKYYKSNEDFVAELNDETGNIEVYALKTVADLVANPSKEISISQARKVKPDVQVGEQLRFQMPTEQLGRISAQMAKQVIFQKIREAERETICAEFQDRLGNLETCTIKRSEGPDLIVDLGRTEARLPRREQSRLESFSPGDRVRIIIKQIEKAGRGPAVIVSRANEELVKRLFEQEVPEIYDGTVKIRACAREAGERTKIAVQSNDRDVDPVGACVGMKGMRVQSIIRELRGEKIDIIEFSEDPIDMATSALSPARISRVTILDQVTRHLEVVVDDMQLSLAIGKKGQNVRLAAKLMGWRIDIKSEEEKRQEVEAAMAAMSSSGTPISVLIDYGLSETIVDRLIEAGTATIEAVADMTPEQLEGVEGVPAGAPEQIQLAVNSYFSQFEAQPAPAEPGVEPAPAGEAPDEAPAPAAGGVAFMPGLPVEGAEEEEDDEEIPFDDFDTIGKRSSFVASPDDPDLDKDGVDDDEDPDREDGYAADDGRESSDSVAASDESGVTQPTTEEERR